MPTNHIKQSIEGAIDFLRKNPDKARYTDSAAVASLQEGLRFRVTDPDGLAMVTDMPKGAGGLGEQPTPGWLFRAALASCVGGLIAMRAAQIGVKLERLSVLVDSESNDFGIFGIDETVPAGPLSMKVLVKIGAKGETENTLRSLAEWGLKHCPVADGVQRQLALKMDLEVHD